MDRDELAELVDGITSAMPTQGVQLPALFHAALFNIAESTESADYVSGWFLQRPEQFPSVIQGLQTLCEHEVLRNDSNSDWPRYRVNDAYREMILGLYKRM